MFWGYIDGEGYGKLGFPIAAGIALLASPIITLAYGVDFSPAVPALRILTLYMPFSFLNATLGTMLASMDKQRLRLFCYLASTVASLSCWTLQQVAVHPEPVEGFAMSTFDSPLIVNCVEGKHLAGRQYSNSHSEERSDEIPSPLSFPRMRESRGGRGA
jgi:hypothetical protein